MSTPAQYEYDVAFSFQGRDEPLAMELNNLLSARVKTFLYSERQKELAGTDGQETFSQVFGKLARLVVIFYREEYGQTPWTRVELDAIKNRSLSDGWDFTVFIPTDEKPSMPAWVPRTRLYIGWDRWGPTGAAASVEARITELGGKPHAETLPERAARFLRAAEFEKLRKQFRESDVGVQSAEGAYGQLTASLSAETGELSDAGVKVQFRVAQNLRLLLGLRAVNAIISFQPRYSNSLDGAFLGVSYWKGLPQGVPGFYGSYRQALKLQTDLFNWELVAPDHSAYVEEAGERRRFDPAGLASHILTRYLDIAERTPLD